MMGSHGVILRLDQDRWREHLQTVSCATPGLVPVIKGNGYGFGLRRLAEESTALGVDTVAAGMAAEVKTVREGFAGNIVILNPWDPASDVATALLADRSVITTVSRLSDLALLAAREDRPRVLVEVLTSMHRFGLAVDELGPAAALLERVDFVGWTIHLPLLDQGRYAEAERLSRAALAAAPGPLWFSHLPAAETVTLARQLGGSGVPVPVRLRVGTRLWLGAASTRTTEATVMAVHQVKRGERAGYRQRVCPADGWIVVIAGGTSHGVGMEAPTSASSIRQRVTALAAGSLEAAGFALSPFTINGRKRWFLEPPHMQSSLIFLPSKESPPTVGDQVPVELRLTTAVVDAIVPH